MTRFRTDLETASWLSILKGQTNCNTVMRISALIRGQSEKAAFGLCMLRQVAFIASGKIHSPKRLASFDRAENHGGLDPPLAKPNWMVMQIYAPLCHKPETVNWTTQKNGGDASWPLVKRAAR